MRVKEPTINRFTAAIETQRVLNQKTHSIVFVRYSYEDVRLFNLQSLLVKPILQPDRAVRLSQLWRFVCARHARKMRAGIAGHGAQSGRGNRRARRNLPLQPVGCDARRVSSTLITRLRLRQLGGNVSFNRLQATYRLITR